VTWVKLSDDFGERAARSGLSDAAFRTHIEALLWTMRRETGGWIHDRDIRRFAETANPAEAVRQLVGLGWWHHPAGDGRHPSGDPDREPGADPSLFRIIANMDDQPEPDVIEARRRKTAERVKRHRRKMAGLDPDQPDSRSNGVTGRVTRDGSGRVGTGRPKTVGRGLKAVDPIVKSAALVARPADVAEQYRPAEGGTSVRPDVSPPTPLQSRKRDHNGSNPNGPDAQHFSTEVHLQSQATDRNAREALRPGERRDCLVCGTANLLVMVTGRFRPHGARHRCPGLPV
jgi:hypothetical protein